MEQFIPLFVVIPLAAAFLSSVVGKFIRRFSEITACVSGVLLLFGAVYCRFLLNNVDKKIIVYKLGGLISPLGITMVLDGLSGFMLLTVNLVSFFVILYSLVDMERYSDKPKFYTLFFLMVCGINGVIITGDLFNLFVFLEVASVSSYALVAFAAEKEVFEASFKYAISGAVSSVFIFLGIAFLYSFTSTLNLADMSRILASKPAGWVVPFASVLFLTGFGLKAALVPFHAWLADAYQSAPTSVSSVLVGISTKTLGVYALARIFFNVIGPARVYLTIFMFLGALSIIIAVILALSQWDLKRLLSYHSISQIGYVVLALGLGTPMGIFGGLFHLFNHSVFKPLLFLNSGAVEYSSGTRNLKRTGGFARVLPVTSKTSLIASMAISGIPPFNGFFSKLLIVFACVERGFLGYGLVAVIGSILTLSSFMKVQKFVFSGELKQEHSNIKEAPFMMRFSMVALAVICVAGGLLLLPSLRFFLKDAADVLLQGAAYAPLVLEAAAK